MTERVKMVEVKCGVSIEERKQTGRLLFNLQQLCVKMIDHRKSLWMHGVDQYGFSVSVRVTDFSPTFMFLSPDLWDDDDEEAAGELFEFVEDLNRKLARDNDEKIKEAEFVYMTPFIGFTNHRKDRMVKLVCQNIDAAQVVIKHLRSERHTLYHADFAFTNQFIQQTGFCRQNWLEINPMRYHNSKVTHASLEGYCCMENITRWEGEDPIQTAPLIKAFLRLKVVSRDAVQLKKYKYHADPTQKYDRILALGVSYIWSGQAAPRPFKEVIYTIIPEDAYVYPEGREVIYRKCPTERDLLEAFQKDLSDTDPDDLFYFPDQHSPLDYYSTRVGTEGSKNGLKLERFKYCKARTIRKSGRVENTRIESRNLFNMEAALQKKVFISVESYDLYTCSCHKNFRKQACQWKDLITDSRLVNKKVAQGHAGRKQIFQQLTQDLRLLAELEHDTGMRLEYANVSKASDTDLTDVVSRGEQIRVFNRLTRFCLEKGFYVNPEKISQKALRFRIQDRPPTYTDPPELKLNTDLRKKCHEYLREKLEYHNPKKSFTANQGGFSVTHFLENSTKLDKHDDDDDDDAEDKKHANDEEEAEGGNVMKPSPKFWGDERVFIWDFASLYPSIMMAFNLSYENLVFDEKYLDLPGVNYINIPINKYECVVSADLPGVIPKMLRMLVDNRTAIKKKMKNEKDPFRKSIYNFEQNSMKVLCNATYGFCGAEKRGAMLAVKPIMYMVTSLGRYLQKECTHYVGVKYKIPTIYGDSVAEATPLLCRFHGSHGTAIFYITAKQLWNKYCQPFMEAAEPESVRSDTKSVRSDIESVKEFAIPGNSRTYSVDVWSDQGWTPVQQVIRHRTGKQLYRVTTSYGSVVVTEDHSLLTRQGVSVSPAEILAQGGRVELKHARLPFMPEVNVMETPDGKSADLRRWRTSCEKDAALCYWRMSTLNQRPHVIHETGSSFHTVQHTPSRHNTSRVATIVPEPSSCESQQYVYDLQTENHHFSAGIGEIVVHNTDSIFTLIRLWDPPADQETGVVPVPTIDQLCEETGKIYEMKDFFGDDAGFTWPQVVNHYATRLKNGKPNPLDVTTFEYRHQVNAFLYLISNKLCDELTARFRYPVIMEFENMADQVWMGWVKKHYCYRFWKEEDPSKVKYIKITGMPVKKREWSPWTRNVLMGVTKCIMDGKLDEIKPFIESNLNDLILGKVPLRKLMVSKGYKNKAAYKHFRQVHLQVMLKIEERERWPVKEKSRVYFVVIKGNDKLYMRSETPDFAVEHELELDMEYYLKNQFEKPMRKLMTYHPELFDFEKLFKRYMARLKMRTGNMGNVIDFNNSTKKKLDPEKAIANLRKKAASTQNRKRKRTQTVEHYKDPFARLIQASTKKKSSAESGTGIQPAMKKPRRDRYFDL